MRGVGFCRRRGGQVCNVKKVQSKTKYAESVVARRNVGSETLCVQKIFYYYYLLPTFQPQNERLTTAERQAFAIGVCF